ncbi:hypothetical protein QTP88_017429 [Uroleucon formosanum]
MFTRWYADGGGFGKRWKVLRIGDLLGVGGEFCCGDRLWLWWTICQLGSLLVQANGDLSVDYAGVWTLEIISDPLEIDLICKQVTLAGNSCVRRRPLSYGVVIIKFERCAL